MKRTFKLQSGNAIEHCYVSGLGLIVAWHRKPPSRADYEEYRRKRHRWVTAALPANRTFVVVDDKPGTLGRLEIVPKVAKKSVI